jgi:hypothetical protein
MIILESFIVLLFTIFVLYIFYCRIFRFSTGDYADPILYLGNSKNIEETAFAPVRDYTIKLDIDTRRQKQYIILVNKQIKLFAQEYSFSNKIKILFDSFLIRNSCRVFGNRISEYYVQCTILNHLYAFCVKYNNLELFYKLFRYFLEIFWLEYNNDISINKFVIRSFRLYPEHIMFYIVTNWKN